MSDSKATPEEAYRVMVPKLSIGDIISKCLETGATGSLPPIFIFPVNVHVNGNQNHVEIFDVEIQDNTLVPETPMQSSNLSSTSSTSS